MPDGFPDGSEGKASACNEGNPEDTGDAGSIPGSGRFPGEGNGNSLQHSCLGNPMDRGAWRATVHRVAKSWTRLNVYTCMQGQCKTGPAEETWPPQGRNLCKSGTPAWRKSALRYRSSSTISSGIWPDTLGPIRWTIKLSFCWSHFELGFLLHAIQIFLNNTVEKAEAHLNKLPKVPQLVSSSAYFIFKKALIWLRWVLVAALRRLVVSGRIFCCSSGVPGLSSCSMWA